MADVNMAYVINGHGMIDWPGRYEIGGTTFYYERDGHREVIRCEGPTTEDFMITVRNVK